MCISFLKDNTMKTLKKPAAALLLIAVTIVWGSGFTIVKLLINAGMPVGMVNMFRGFGLALLVAVFFGKQLIKMSLREAAVGIIAGVFNAGGYLLQSAGLTMTTPSTSAFLTILNTVFVPIIAFLVYKVKPGLRLLPAILLAVVGTFFLTGMSFDNFTLGKGEWLTIGCALCYAALIAFIGNTGKGVPSYTTAFWMGIMQGVGSLAYFFVFDGGTVGAIDLARIILPIAYIVVLGSFFTTFAQVVSQKSIDSASAAMIMTLEAVFGTLISLIAGYDKFGWRLGLGGALILAGVIIVLLPEDKLPKIRFKKAAAAPGSEAVSARNEDTDSVDGITKA